MSLSEFDEKGKLTTKARRDLEAIIELSKQIKKNSDRFGKDAPQRKKGNSS